MQTGSLWGGLWSITAGTTSFEPAFWGKAIFIGPHVQNFTEEVAYLKSRDAIVQVRDTDELSTQWRDIHENAILREQREGAVRAAYQHLPDHETEYIDLIKAALIDITKARTDEMRLVEAIVHPLDDPAYALSNVSQ